MKMRSDRYKTNKKKLFLVILISFILFVGIIFLYARFFGTKGLIVKEARITNDKLPYDFNGLKIVHFSDLYYGSTVNYKDLKKITNQINLLKTDIVVFTGDLIKNDANLTKKEINELTNELKNINSKYGKYSIKGNNDYNDNYEIIMRNSDFKILENEYDLIYNNNNEYIFLNGLSSNIKTNIDYNKAFEYFNDVNNKNIFSITLTHEPDNTDEILKHNNVDLILAGHSLGGQIRFPYIGPIMKNKGATKYFKDYYKISNTNLFISSGIGIDTSPIRLFNKPSINFYRISNN